MEARTADGDVISYEYDNENIRVSSSINGAKTTYLVDANRPYAQVLEEYEDENVKVRYVHGLDLISVEQEGEVSVYLVDGLGSTRVLVDESGEVVAGYTYDAFGELISESGDVENSYLFAGEQFDGELGQYYLRDRYYDQGVGRFTRRDVYEGFFNKPSSLHKYVYTDNNPVNYNDPTGLSRFLTRQQRKEIGNEIHKIIGEDFISTSRDRRADIPEPNRGLTIKKILREADGLTNGHPGWNRLKPDLADYDTREIYEIKSFSNLAQAHLEVIVYEAVLNRAPGQTNNWEAGSAANYTFTGGPIALPYGKTAYVLPPRNGVILYRLLDDDLDPKVSTSTIVATTAILTSLIVQAAVRSSRAPSLAF